MLISEVQPDDLKEAIPNTISRINKIINEIEKSSYPLKEEMVDRLQKALKDLSPDLNESIRVQLWKSSYRIWNLCVDMANSLNLEYRISVTQARLRNLACDLLVIASEVSSIKSCFLKIASFFSRTGSIWHELRNYEMAETCFSRSTEFCCHARDRKEGLSKQEDDELNILNFELYISRAKTAWELHQKILSENLLGRANSLIPSLPEKRFELAQVYFSYGQKLLNDRVTNDSATESLSYFEHAFELCSEGLKCNKNAKSAEIQSYQTLNLKILRYLAGTHIQNERYESALNCVASLKLSMDQQPCVSWLELKALNGLKRYDEALTVFESLLSHKDLTAEIAISSLLNVLQTQNSLALPAVKQNFFILQSKFPSNRELVILTLEKLLQNPVNKDYIQFALEIVRSEQIRLLIQNSADPLPNANNSENKERNYSECHLVFGLLWNCGSDHYRAKEFQLSRNLFDASMLYIPHDDRLQRAKALRVLCLCHLGVLEYERALECITLAEILDSSISCIFLKYKIALETKNESEALNQINLMLQFPDFDPNFLSLASQEAISCNNTIVSLSALRSLLHVCSSEKKHIIQTKECVVFRNIIALTMDQEKNAAAVLTYYEQARVRVSQIGFFGFFGEGSMGEKEAKWFASSAWNHGLFCGKKGDWKSCSSFFQCASDIYELVPDNMSSENLSSLKMSTLLTASSIMANDSKSDDALKLATSYLMKCQSASSALSSISTDSSPHPDNKLEFYIQMLLFAIKVNLGDLNSQAEILEHCKKIKGTNAQHLFKMGSFALRENGGKEVEIPMAAFRMGLKMILGEPHPDYALAASAMRQLITLADIMDKDSKEVSNLYEECRSILVGLVPDLYPKDEIHWLVSTAWNRSHALVRSNRLDDAHRWMNVAFSLLKFSPSLSSYEEVMKNGLEELEKMRNGLDHSSPVEE